MKKAAGYISRRRMRRLPKIQVHEHLDCSLRPATMLELWDKIGFNKAKTEFPKDILWNWMQYRIGEIPSSRKPLSAFGMWGAGQASTINPEESKLQQQHRQTAASQYHRFLVQFASTSLENYLQAIGDHILPLMQNTENLAQITRERIEDAVFDGHIALELRFAPQLHAANGLSLEQVMEAVIGEVERSPIPVDLTLCALRHENAEMARQLGDLCLKYEKQVGCFDLAGGESAFPGVLDWWLEEALRARELRSQPGRRPLQVKCHLWETNQPTDDDVARLNKHGIVNIGHGVRLADAPPFTFFDSSAPFVPGWFLECCPTSNVVTGQYKSIYHHPINRLYNEGYRVTVNTDGTLFNRVGLTDEYMKLQSVFGWGLHHFHRVNLTAIAASNFPDNVKASLRQRLAQTYLQA